jgi:hypothetical protein
MFFLFKKTRFKIMISLVTWGKEKMRFSPETMSSVSQS